MTLSLQHPTIHRHALAILTLLALGLTTLAPHAVAQDSAAVTGIDGCRMEIESELATMHREQRYILLGQKRAAEEPLNASRYDARGDRWFKKEPNLWAAPDGSEAGNQGMDAIAEFPVRQGLFETRGVMTSELVPAMTQSYRGLLCTTEAVCRAAGMSAEELEEERTRGTAALRARGIMVPVGKVPIAPAGCDWILVNEMRSCQDAQKTYTSGGIGRSLCEPIADALTSREAQVLRMLTAYDAAERSLLQFTGTFDSFLTSFKGNLLGPIEQVTSIVGQLGRIPCFLV